MQSEERTKLWWWHTEMDVVNGKCWLHMVTANYNNFRIFRVWADRQAAAAAAAALIFSCHLCGCCWSAYMAIVETNKNGIFFSPWFKYLRIMYSWVLHAVFVSFYSLFSYSLCLLFFLFLSFCSIPSPALCVLPQQFGVFVCVPKCF